MLMKTVIDNITVTPEKKIILRISAFADEAKILEIRIQSHFFSATKNLILILRTSKIDNRLEPEAS